MKNIKVFLASSDELKTERVELGDLFHHLNRIFKCRGIQLELSEWEYLDSSVGAEHKQEEYNQELRTCELCLVLWWTKFGSYTRQEFETAYEELKAGRMPKKLYIFFKEPGDISPDLQKFKESFDTKYGHFYCKFENTDALKLHFVLQLEIYNNDTGLIKVEDSKVKIDGETIARLDNIPFASHNAHYQDLKQRIAQIEDEIETYKTILATTPNDGIAKLLGQKQSERYRMKEELSQHEKFLFDTALRIAQLTGSRISERMQRAIRAFEAGQVREANTILDEAERDAEELLTQFRQTKRLLEEERESLFLSIEELSLKASVMLADNSYSIEERIEKTDDIYRTAITLAQECDYDKRKYADLLAEQSGFLYRYAKYPEAMSAYQKALEIRIEVLGERHPDTATSLNNIGLVYYCQGNYEKAIKYYQKAMKIQTGILGERHPDTANSLNCIGGVYYNQGNYEKAIECYQKAMEIQTEVLGEKHPNTATSLNNIGAVYNDQGYYEKALECYQKAMKIRIEVFGKRHPDTAASLNNIGLVYYRQQYYEKALECYQKAMEIQTEALGERHPDTAASLNNIGGVYDNQGNYERAFECYQKAMEIQTEVLGERHPNTAISLNNIGTVYYYQGNYKKAFECYQKALEIQTKILGEKHPNTATSLYCIGIVYYRQGNFDKAIECYQKALEIRIEVLGEKHPNTIAIKNVLDSLRNNSETTTPKD